MRCKDCEYVKCYAVNKKIYYCDNRNRTNLMGKLGEDTLPETSPEWCPKNKVTGRMKGLDK